MLHTKSLKIHSTLYVSLMAVLISLTLSACGGDGGDSGTTASATLHSASNQT